MINRFIKSSIKIYQRKVSPKKGYCCAHAVYYGGDSCSEFGYKAIHERGLIYFITSMCSRILVCRKSAIMLSEQNIENDSPDEKKDNNDKINGKEATKQIAACCLSIFPIGK